MTEAIFRERLKAIIDWADLAMKNRAEFDSHGVRNLDGPIFDAAREALAAAPAPQVMGDDWFSQVVSFFVKHGMLDAREEYDVSDVMTALADNYEPMPHVTAPKGWKLVPVEPTHDMLKRGVDRALRSAISGAYRWPDYMADLYRDMIDPAPPAPAQQVMGDE